MNKTALLLLYYKQQRLVSRKLMTNLLKNWLTFLSLVTPCCSMGKQITYLIYILITFVYIFYIHQSPHWETRPYKHVHHPRTFHLHSWGSCGTTFQLRRSVTDIQVRGTRLCVGTNIRRKQLEMKVIFQLGTAQPEGLNMNFKHVWTVRRLLSTRTRFYLR